jgi:hypothetical protein
MGAGADAALGERGLSSATIPPHLARSGGLLGCCVDHYPMFRRAAVFVDKILKRAKPGDLPIEQPTKFVTIVNLKRSASTFHRHCSPAPTILVLPMMFEGPPRI